MVGRRRASGTFVTLCIQRDHRAIAPRAADVLPACAGDG
jgi:hypothetical protein